MSSSFRAAATPPGDEINISSLLKAIWQQKKLIVLTSVGAVLVAAAYVFLATPEYQVSSVLRPAALNELDALNRSDIYSIPPEAALMRVGAALESYDIRLGFFRSNQKLFRDFVRPGETLEQSFEEFNHDSISLILPDSKRPSLLNSYIKLEMKYPKGVDGVAILNGFVDYAISTERQQIAADLSVIVKNRQGELSNKLAAARSSYDIDKQAKIAALTESDNLKRAQLKDELDALLIQLKRLRNDRIAQLDEAVRIATDLGIRKPTTPSSLGDNERLGVSSIMRTEVNSQQIPLYFMGVEALEAERKALTRRTSDSFTDIRIAQIAKELKLLESNREIQVLNGRKNEDLFLSGVQPLRAEIARLEKLESNLDISNIGLVSIDQKALEPVSPIKPKKTLIIILGALCGFVGGLIIAIARKSTPAYTFSARAVGRISESEAGTRPKHERAGAGSV